MHCNTIQSTSTPAASGRPFGSSDNCTNRSKHSCPANSGTAPVIIHSGRTQRSSRSSSLFAVRNGTVSTASSHHMGAGANLENIAAASRSTTVYGDGKAETLAIDPYDAYQKELEDFIGHIEAGTPITVITPADVRHVISVIVAIRESLETQKTVTVS